MLTIHSVKPSGVRHIYNIATSLLTDKYRYDIVVDKSRDGYDVKNIDVFDSKSGDKLSFTYIDENGLTVPYDTINLANVLDASHFLERYETELNDASKAYGLRARVKIKDRYRTMPPYFYADKNYSVIVQNYHKYLEQLHALGVNDNYIDTGKRTKISDKQLMAIDLAIHRAKELVKIGHFFMNLPPEFKGKISITAFNRRKAKLRKYTDSIYTKLTSVNDAAKLETV